MTELRIIGLLITDRIKEAGKTQEVLTRHAHIIKSRLGFHEVSESICSRVGFIILQVVGNNEEFENFLKELNEIRGVEVQQMVFHY
jgi:metal-responsive CopG/Arc/MetJ family transcriptional regulator